MNIASIDNSQSKAAYLRSLPAIRERCEQVHELAREGKLQYFDYHQEKEADVAEFCIELMKVRSTIAHAIFTNENSSEIMEPISPL